MKTESIDVRRIDLGVGVLRGVLSRPELFAADAVQIEQAIEHIRGAARLVERIQQQIWKRRSAGSKKRRRRR